MSEIKDKLTHIWWVNQFAVLPSEPGGGRHMQLAKTLLNNGIDTSIITSSNNYMSGVRDTTSVQNGVTTIPTGWNGKNPISKFMKMRSFGSKVSKSQWTSNLPKPKIIIGSSPSLHAAYGALRLARSKGVPYIFEIRDIWPESLIQITKLSKNHPVIRLLKKLEQTLIQEADAIISTMPLACDYYKRYGVSKDKFTWISNGVDLDAFTTEQGAETNGKNVLYAGAHGPPNGIEVMLKAAKVLEDNCSNVNFRFVGSGSIKEELVQQASDLGLNNVSFEPPVSRSQMPSLLQEADVLLIHFEDLELYQYGVSPNKLFEYMASGKPVIFATTASENPLTIANAGNAVEPNNPQALAGEIERVLSLDKTVRDEQSRNARNYVTANNSFEVLAQKTCELIDKVLGK